VRNREHGPSSNKSIQSLPDLVLGFPVHTTGRLRSPLGSAPRGGEMRLERRISLTRVNRPLPVQDTPQPANWQRRVTRSSLVPKATR
jgi:hypothetical protein